MSVSRETSENREKPPTITVVSAKSETEREATDVESLDSQAAKLDVKSLVNPPSSPRSLRTKSIRRTRVITDGSTDTCHHVSKQMEDLLKNASQRDSHEEISNIQELIVPQKSSLFKRSIPTSKLLQWSKASILSPLTKIEDEDIRDKAVECFRIIQLFMNDRMVHSWFSKNKPITREDAFSKLQSVVSEAISKDPLKDEIYLHIYKQLCQNPKRTSELFGWEIMCIYCSIFTPSKGLFPFLIQFMDESLKRLSENTTDEEDKKLQNMIEFSKRKLTRLMELPPRRQAPKVREIIHIATISPFRNNVFGETLEDIMKAEENRDESGLYPRVLRFLAEAVILLKGCETQGIFRVPGDVDQVINLKLKIEQGTYDISNLDDPAVPASLLKQWLRELVNPVIPNEFYDRCLAVGDDVDEAMNIVDDLPELNRNVLKYMAKYLQVVGDPKYQPLTKMTISNLSMVFAPNLLRCPSDNPLVILANQKAEQNFLKILVNYLEE